VRGSSIEQASHWFVGEHWCGEREARVSPIEDIGEYISDNTRITIQDPPRPRSPSNRRPVMHFSGIHTDDVSRPGFNLPSAAPRRVTSSVDDSDSILIVRMARE
jgi:hypothetical protein